VFAFWKPEVRQFLIDNADFFIREYRIDGLRYDQASVIDQENADSGWLFCQDCTDTVRASRSGAIQIAEYWPRQPHVTNPRAVNGAGFDATWNDGVREALRAVVAQAAAGSQAGLDLDGLAREIVNPGFRENWRAVNYVESHDHVRAGDDRQDRLARLADGSNPRSWYARSRARAATALLLTAPGIPMLFMGQEILEDKRWSDDPGGQPGTLVWWEGLEQGEKPMVDFHRFTRELLWLRRRLPALRRGAARVCHVDRTARVLALHRWIEGEGRDVLVVASFAESTHWRYRLGLPLGGPWQEALNSDVFDNWFNPLAAGNGGGVVAEPVPYHGFGFSAELVLPANATLILASAGAG
jgi:1,4-alpha-glucan branching enzyme